MRLMRTAIAVVLALSATSTFIASPAAAQPPPVEDWKRAARELADKGYEHYEAGDYANAVKYFRDAESRFHAPSLLLMQANAHVKLGQLVEAEPLYQKIVEEPLPADAPQEFRDAQIEAAATLERVSLRIATLKITLKGMTADQVKITIDDVEIPSEKVLQPLRVNPGTRKIVATIGGDDGGRAVFQSVTLKDGVTKQIQLVFRPGGPVGTAPSSGGCASCEVASGRSPGGTRSAQTGILAMLATGTLLRWRRRSRAPGPTTSR